MRRCGWALPALVAGSLLFGCGGDDEPAPADSGKPPLTVPSDSTSTRTGPATGGENTSTVPPASTDTTPGGGTTTGPMDQPNPGNGGVPAPNGNDGTADPAQPDSPTNDTPPEPDSPQDRFEQFCSKNPGAC